MGYHWLLCTLLLLQGSLCAKVHLFSFSLNEQKELKSSCHKYHLRARVGSLIAFERYLKSLPRKDVVIYIPHEKAMLVANEKKIMKAFKAYKHELIVQAETSKTLKKRQKVAFGNVAAIGSASAMLKWLKKEALNVRLDRSCKIFIPLEGLLFHEIEIDLKDDALNILPTQTSPCVVLAHQMRVAMFEAIFQRLIGPQNWGLSSNL